MTFLGKTLFKLLVWLFEGILVGFGAIMPGLSGGTLCVAFGMYHPIISVLSSPRDNIRKYFPMLSVFVLGGALGFLGLSGIGAFLLRTSPVLVICVFVGFIIGTLPSLWSQAGAKQRNAKSYISLLLGFVLMYALLLFLNSGNSVALSEGYLSYIFCGILWGLSFIIPGLSSSTLIIFFGLYEPMLSGISTLKLNVICPIAIGAVISVLLLSSIINKAYCKFHSVMSHFIIGLMCATTIMIIPRMEFDFVGVITYLLCIFSGAIISFILTRICDDLKNN